MFAGAKCAFLDGLPTAEGTRPELGPKAGPERLKNSENTEERPQVQMFSRTDRGLPASGTAAPRRLGKGTAAVVIFPAHTADHDGLSSADNKARTCKVVGQGTTKPFHELSELHQTVLHAQCRGLSANILTAEK
jgi:hypothetical protein